MLMLMPRDARHIDAKMLPSLRRCRHYDADTPMLAFAMLLMLITMLHYALIYDAADADVPCRRDYCQLIFCH